MFNNQRKGEHTMKITWCKDIVSVNGVSYNASNSVETEVGKFKIEKEHQCDQPGFNKPCCHIYYYLYHNDQYITYWVDRHCVPGKWSGNSCPYEGSCKWNEARDMTEILGYESDPNQIVDVPANSHNKKRVKRAIAKALQREGRKCSISDAIGVVENKVGNETKLFLSFLTPYDRVDRAAYRYLLHDWQERKLKDVPRPKYPIIVYEYYEKHGTRTIQIRTVQGILYPDGSFEERIETEENRSDPVSSLQI